MSEQRLIDANGLYSKFIDGESDTEQEKNANQISRYLIRHAPTIDPETLPIVQELRGQLAEATAERDAIKSNPPVKIEPNAFELAAQLAKVTAERDAAIDLAGRLVAICTPPKEWEPKLFRRIIRGIGDYMGTGYAFLDAFYKEYDDFQESDGTGVLKDILDIAERKRKPKQEVQDDE